MPVGDLLDGLPFGIEFRGWATNRLEGKRLVNLQGVEDAVELSIGNVTRGRVHGAVLGPANGATRIITATVRLHATDDETLRAKVNALTVATPISDTEDELAWVARDMAQPRISRARVIGRLLPIDADFVNGVGTATIKWEATDPRMYGGVEWSGSTGVGSVSGGLAFPHGFPHGFGIAEAGTVETENSGSTPAPWSATLTGPLTSPSITLISADATGVLEMAGFELAAGETLEFDSLERTVLLGGTASRAGSLTTRRWFHLPPGTSAVQLGATAGTGTMTLRWRDTWL